MADLLINDLHVAYGPVEVLHGVTMRAVEGQIAALIGHNGAGKSTVLKAAAGLAPVISGGIHVGEKEITRQKPHKILASGVAYMAQGQDLFPRMTVRENVWMGGYLLPSRVRQERLTECLQMFPALMVKREARAESLSGGQRQQLKLARSLMTRPSVLLLDEPSVGLSPDLVADAMRRLKELRDQTGVAMILVEQNVQQALDVADVVYVLEVGQVAAVGDPKKLHEDGTVREIFLKAGTAVEEG